MKTRIIIPTYNEQENVVPLMDELFRLMPKDTNILVVDDNSPDGTSGLIRDYMAKDARVSLMVRSDKLGLGSAYKAAFKKVLVEGRDECVVTIDADFSHNPKYVEGLVKLAESHDLVIGSRYIAGGETENWSFGRKLLSMGGNFYARWITGLPVRDLTAGFSCMRTDFLQEVPFEQVQSKGYAWWIALRTLFYRRGARIKEMPIRFTERRLGKSKLSSNIIYEGLIEPWRIRFSKL